MKCYDAHLDQYGDQSGGWGSEEQLRGAAALSGANRVFFCEVDGEYPSSVEEHLSAADDIRHRLLPQNTPSEWKIGGNYHYHVEGLESPKTPEDVDFALDTFHRWGVRGTNPIYHVYNPIGGCSKESGRGITELGWHLVEGVWRRGWWLDAAHMSAPSITDVLARWQPASGEKFCYTHGGVQHEQITNPLLTNGNIERCLTMAHALEIVRRGGLVCLSPCQPFYPSFEGVFMDHLRELGEASCWRGVGIGTDYGGILDEWRFEGCSTIADCFEQLVVALRRNAFTEDQIEAIVGGNARRFFLGR